MKIESGFQVQAPYYREMSSTGSGKQSGQELPPFASYINISGAERSRLAAEQQAGSDMQADNLPIGTKHMLEDMVNDQAYGAKMADGYANNVHTACMTLPEYIQAKGTLEAGQKQLQTAWQDIRSQGESPAQSYADLLKYELSMSRSYWNAQDPGHTMVDIHGFAEDKLAYLQQYRAAKE